MKQQLIRGHSSLWRSLASDFGEIRGHLTIHLLNHWISGGFHSTHRLSDICLIFISLNWE